MRFVTIVRGGFGARRVALPFLLRCFMKQIVTRLWQMLFARNYLEQRAKRGSREKFERALSRVPDVEPEEHDKL